MRSKKGKQIEESLEEQGHSLLIVDLLNLPKKFSFKRYRIDIVGFAAAWIFVFIILYLTIWFARIGG
jgi:hypothetical protein